MAPRFFESGEFFFMCLFRSFSLRFFEINGVSESIWYICTESFHHIDATFM
jgi:hypothetical protein